MSYSYSHSSSSLASSGTTVSSDTSSSSITYTSATQLSSPDNSDGLYGSFGADATALGSDTLSLAGIFATVVDQGSMATLDGTAAALAAASGDETAFADASTSANVAGADFVHTYTVTSNATQDTPTGTTTVAGSTTAVEAYELQPPAGRLDIATVGGSTPIVDAVSAVNSPHLGDASINLDGNFAAVDFNVAAIADDTFAAVDAFALTIEGDLSVSTVFAELAV